MPTDANSPGACTRLVRSRYGIGIATLSILAIFAARGVLPVYRQFTAIQTIKRMDGYVDTQTLSWPLLRRWSGERSDEMLAVVEYVDLSPSNVTDSDLTCLCNLPRLRTLDLHETAISDAGMEVVGRLTSVEWLSLEGTRVGDRGVAQIARLSHLIQLDLGNTQVTDACVPMLVGLKSLRILDFEGTAISDLSLVHIGEMEELEDLWLSNTGVTDAGIANLERCGKLRLLYLEGTRVTDAGLESLRELNSLETLSLCDTDVTDAGEDTIQQALPGLKIFRWKRKEKLGRSF